MVKLGLEDRSGFVLKGKAKIDKFPTDSDFLCAPLFNFHLL